MNDLIHHVVNSNVCLVVGVAVFLFFIFVLPEIRKELSRKEEEDEGEKK